MRSAKTQPVIVGSLEDPHVSAVVERAGCPVAILDAESLASRQFSLDGDGLTFGGRRIGKRGWLRRLASPQWAASLRESDIVAAERGASLSALAALVRDNRISWLTPVDRIAAAEGKPWQYRIAASVGACVPRWLVTNDPTALRDEQWVVKPLGPGRFFDANGAERVVPVTEFRSQDIDAVRAAPFIFQKLIKARMHARVVTVRQKAFSSTLAADGLPLDWRTSEEAHRSFEPCPVSDGVLDQARAIAQACGVGYSSQDWVRDGDGRWWFLDLNPSGQWLFLPNSVSQLVSLEIARWIHI